MILYFILVKSFAFNLKYNYSRVLLMKRCGVPLDQPQAPRKRPFRSQSLDEELPFKLKMLKNWKVTP